LTLGIEGRGDVGGGQDPVVFAARGLGDRLDQLEVGLLGEGDTYEEALADVKSAIAFHVETFGTDIFEDDDTTLKAFIAEARIAI
jgi:hypothetical protein